MLESVSVKSGDNALDASLLKGYIRQHPNSKWFSLLKVPMGPYALSGRDTTKRINRFLQRIGEAPVIFDTLQANRAQENMLSAVNNLGFLQANVRQERIVKGKKVRLTFMVEPGERYHVRHIDYEIEDTAVARILRQYADRTLLQEGMPFDLNQLDAERGRISSRLQNNGYYRFNKEFVRYEADTCVGDHGVDLNVQIPLYRATVDGDSMLHPRYVVRNVSFVSSAAQVEGRRDTSDMDSITYGGFPIYFHGKLPFRPSLFVQNNVIEPGNLYREQDVRRTYSNLGQLGAVMFSNIRMEDCFAHRRQNRKPML